jgi:hypothetical protein
MTLTLLHLEQVHLNPILGSPGHTAHLVQLKAVSNSYNLIDAHPSPLTMEPATIDLSTSYNVPLTSCTLVHLSNPPFDLASYHATPQLLAEHCTP